MKLSTLPLLCLLVTSASAGSLFQQLAGNQVSIAAGAQIPGENPLQHCEDDTSEDALTIERVNLLPNPPVPGQPLTIEAVGTLKEAVNPGAIVYVTVKYGLITLVKQELDLCDHVDEVDLKCPIEKGKLVLAKVVDIPKQIPPGKYTVKAEAVLEDDSRLTCLVGTVLFSL
ncbi:phosphatidylglycerol/phosphatidylinositol transfer protein [Choiromyces venosus 120613-1]|uniref:Phosphatidylglycerol/phosphatidylinositol transfer protein n=1 Tax=Choiromyces venosus 120613-1 TaxID=1336337 RepID=A0A3N4JAQ8_9PEZI|nr:phosphatidylglycerol/phosphatidylinositol transfer protein [Choiromyces venosus 120613-1]